MNYKAAKRKDGFVFAYQNNEGTVKALGYCAGLQSVKKSDIIDGSELVNRKEYAHKFHTDGHDTEDEACNCYIEFMIEVRGNSNAYLPKKQDCEICGKETKKGIKAGPLCIMALCDKHRTTDNAKALLMESGCLWL